MKKNIHNISFLSAFLITLAAAGLIHHNLFDSRRLFGMENENKKVEIFNIQKDKASLVEKIIKSEDEWKQLLTSQAFAITRKKSTETAFTGEYHDNKRKGIYYCIGCGTALFLSDSKFDSGTGWPSFWTPAAKENITIVDDSSFFMQRTEVLCTRCDAHLGHIFDDGPQATGKRYCINSAALKFEEK